MENLKEERTYVVYKHTSPSGKCYIGITNNYRKRCIQHRSSNNKCRLFTNAIKKYGWDNFVHEILEENLTLQEANNKEREYIDKYNSLSPGGYNLTTGGEGFKVSDETKEKHQGLYKGNSTGISGITFRRNKYIIKYSINGEDFYLGNYDTLEDAIEARTLGCRTEKANDIKQSRLGIIGIHLVKGSYRVAISIEGKVKCLGNYSNLEDAIEAKSLGYKTDKVNKKGKINTSGELQIVIVNSVSGNLYKVNSVNRGYLGTYSNIEDAIEARDLNCRTDKCREVTKTNTGLLGIKFERNMYYVRKSIDGKYVKLGKYINLEDAIEARDLGIITNKSMKGTEGKISSNNKLGEFGIHMDKNKYNVVLKGRSLGNYDTLEDAIEARTLGCRTEKANVRKPPISGESGINKKGDKYIVRGTVNGSSISLGVYNNLDDAIEAKRLNMKTPKANAIGRKSKIKEPAESSEIKLRD